MARKTFVLGGLGGAFGAVGNSHHPGGTGLESGIGSAFEIAAQAYKYVHPPPGVYAPWTPQQTYEFVGVLTNGTDVATFSFSVLANAPPRVTGGWAKINVIDRPQRLGMTVAQGYDPVTLEVPVQFEAVVRQPPGKRAIPGAGVEYDIQQLEWMAGRGKLYGSRQDNKVGHPAVGDPPLVSVASFRSDGTESNLIPPNLHGIEWLLSHVEYDANPIRNRHGDRTRQVATVTLTEYVASPGTTYDSPATRARAKGHHGYKGFFTTNAVDTIAKITEHHAPKATHKNKLEVLDYNKSRLKVRSLHQHLKGHTEVRIPNSVLVP